MTATGKLDEARVLDTVRLAGREREDRPAPERDVRIEFDVVVGAGQNLDPFAVCFFFVGPGEVELRLGHSSLDTRQRRHSSVAGNRGTE